jgi:hypothetical protein
MGDTQVPHSPRAERAKALLAAAVAQQVPVVALGGVAVELLCPSARPGGPWSRTLADIDVATVGKSRPRVDVLVRDHAAVAGTAAHQAPGREGREQGPV